MKNQKNVILSKPQKPETDPEAEKNDKLIRQYLIPVGKEWAFYCPLCKEFHLTGENNPPLIFEGKITFFSSMSIREEHPNYSKEVCHPIIFDNFILYHYHSSHKRETLKLCKLSNLCLTKADKTYEDLQINWYKFRYEYGLGRIKPYVLKSNLKHNQN